jgi:multicomponent Na+:H+ antiporter subunit E
MKSLFWNLSLALAWVAVTGDLTGRNLLLGFLIGFLVLFFTSPIIGTPAYVRKVIQVLNLALFFIWELILSNLRVTLEVLTPGYQLRPGVVAIPLDARSDAEILLLTTLITLTPGSIAIDISNDRHELYLHTMYMSDPEEVRRQIKTGFERRVLEVLR